MVYLKVLFFLFISVSILFADESDDIFSENISSSKDNKNISKKENDIYFDSLLEIEKDRKKFEEILSDAKEKADKNYFRSAFSLLQQASNMNMNEKEVLLVKKEVEKKRQNYLREKENERRRIAQERKEEQERIARRQQEELNNAILLSSLNNTLQKQQRINEQSKKRLEKLMNSAYKKEQKNYTHTTSNSYHKNNQLKQEQLKQAQLEQEKKQEELRRKKLEKENQKRQKELEKRREKEKIENQRAIYLNKMKNGISLYGKMCFGEHSVVVSSIPKIKPEAVSCIDVYYKVTCRNNRTQIATGLMHNLVDMGTGCYGDTKEVSPRLSCIPEDYEVSVTKVLKCPTAFD